MDTLRLFMLLVGIGFLWFIIRKLIKDWLGGPDRKQLYHEMDSEERMIERDAGEDIPVCPLCGSLTKLHSYPHIRVWRCVEYPDCRGFMKARKPRRMKFASDWDRNSRKKGR